MRKMSEFFSMYKEYFKQSICSRDSAQQSLLSKTISEVKEKFLQNFKQFTNIIGRRREHNKYVRKSNNTLQAHQLLPVSYKENV